MSPERKARPRKETQVTVEDRAASLVMKAREITVSRLRPGDELAERRLDNVLNNNFLPYVEENLILAEQLASPEYVRLAEKVENFLDTSTGFIFCVDGRLSVLAFGVPRAEEFTRRPSGMPITRKSTEDGLPVLDDPDLAASINIKMEERKEEGKSTNQVEFITYHIDSEHPNHGCGAEIAVAEELGHSADVAMIHGRIPEWFTRLGDHFESFNVNAERAGGEGVTFDVVHDAHTDGLIFGTRNVIQDFKEDESLRQNLDRLQSEGKILMTETLDEPFGPEIFKEAAKLGKVKLDLKDPRQFKDNVITIGEIAMKLTKQAEERGFDFIPDSIRQQAKAGNEERPYALRALAFTAFFNTVYRTLGRIQAGDHDLLKHPEKLVSIGSVGSIANRNHIAFLHKIPSGEIHQEDVKTARFLHNLNGKVAKELGIDLTKQGRIIVLTGQYNPDIYVDDKAAARELEKVKSTVRNNAAKLRECFKPSVESGESIIFGVIHHPGSREILDVC